MDVEPDGVSFDPSSIVVVPIREEDAYGGRKAKGERRKAKGHLGRARLTVQIDVGVRGRQRCSFSA